MNFSSSSIFGSRHSLVLLAAVVTTFFVSQEPSLGQAISQVSQPSNALPSDFQWTSIRGLKTEFSQPLLSISSAISWRDLPEPVENASATRPVANANFQWQPIEQPQKKPLSNFSFDHLLPPPAAKQMSSGSETASVPWDNTLQIDRVVNHNTVQVAQGTSIDLATNPGQVQTELAPDQIQIASFSASDDTGNSPVKEAVNVQATLESYQTALTSSVQAENFSTVEAESPSANSQTTSEPELSALQFDSASYTGPMKEATKLFSNLKIKNDFRLEAQQLAEPARTSHSAEGALTYWAQQPFTWAAPSFFHRPLYFEQVNLERYGMGPRCCLQPTYSSLHFFGSIAILPYKWVTQHPQEKYYTLGHHRPGNCAPYQRKSWLGQSSFGETFLYWDKSSGYQ